MVIIIMIPKKQKKLIGKQINSKRKDKCKHYRNLQRVGSTDTSLAREEPREADYETPKEKVYPAVNNATSCILIIFLARDPHGSLFVCLFVCLCFVCCLQAFRFDWKVIQ